MFLLFFWLFVLNACYVVGCPFFVRAKFFQQIFYHTITSSGCLANAVTLENHSWITCVFYSNVMMMMLLKKLAMQSAKVVDKSKRP